MRLSFSACAFLDAVRGYDGHVNDQSMARDLELRAFNVSTLGMLFCGSHELIQIGVQLVIILLQRGMICESTMVEAKSPLCMIFWGDGACYALCASLRRAGC